MTESQIERELLDKLAELKYTPRPDIRDRAALECNFREKFEALNRVHLTDTEFQRLLEKITTPDVFAAARTLRKMDTFERDDGTPLNYTHTYQHRKEEARYARRVGMEEIEKNDVNLNISRYVSTAVAEEEIDLAATHRQLVEIKVEIERAKAKHNEFLKELGLPPLP